MMMVVIDRNGRERITYRMHSNPVPIWMHFSGAARQPCWAIVCVCVIVSARTNAPNAVRRCCRNANKTARQTKYIRVSKQYELRITIMVMICIMHVHIARENPLKSNIGLDM